MENHLPLPVFDDFEYFKKFIYKKEGPVIENYTHEDQTYIIKSSNIDFYHHYIKPFGFEFIENKASQVISNTLKKELESYIQQSKNYKIVAEYKIVHFLEHISVKTHYLQELKAFAPFDYLEDFITKSNTIRNEKALEEISAILIAYCKERISSEIRWFLFMHMFCKRFGNQKGQEFANNVFEQANTYLEAYGQKVHSPYSSYTYPIRLAENTDIDRFVKTYNSIVSSNQKGLFEHVHIGKQTFYNNYVQLFPLYADLRNLHDEDYFAPCLKHKDQELAKRTKLFGYIYENSYTEELKRFQDFLSMIECDFLSDKLSSYVPVSSYSIKKFIKNNLLKGKKDAFEKYLGILLTYWLYDEEDISFSTSLHIHNMLKMYLSNTKTLKEAALTHTANAIIREANFFGKYLNLPLIPYASNCIAKFPESGERSLPWKYVQFKDNYILLHHPNHYMKQEADSHSKTAYTPFRLDMINSKKAYNGIKLYFENVVPMLRVRCVKGHIISVNKDSRIDLDNYVTSILYRTSRANVKIEIKPREDKDKYRTYTKQEASSLAQMSKSHYLEELCKMQLLAYKVYHFTETRANVSSFASEDIFCFVLKEAYSYLVIAIENTLDSRSTILFYIKKDELPRALDVINVFFASNTLNKRQSLQWKAVDFNDSSIIRYERIIHTSFGEWKELMNHYTR